MNSDLHSLPRAAHVAKLFTVLAISGLILAEAGRAQTEKNPPPAPSRPEITQQFAALPLSFEQNQGQADSTVEYLTHGQGYTLYLTAKGAMLSLRAPAKSNQDAGSVITPYLRLVGANLNSEVCGEQELPGKVNYLLGNDPKNWKTNLSTYAKVLYRDVYPGIDLVFYGNQGRLEFDFVVHPGANPNSIQLEDPLAQAQVLEPSGNIIYEYAGGRITLHRPVSYVSEGTQRQEVASNYVLERNGRISFGLKNYDPNKTLVIDPSLSYSTFLGGSTAAILPSKVAVDELGEAIVAGMAATTYPMTAGAFQTAAPPAGETYVPFVLKLNASGTALVYATFLGGIEPGPYVPYPDAVTAVAADSSGNAYLTGHANTLNFPTTANAFQSASPCLVANRSNGLCTHSVAFVTELNPTGSGLVFSTFLGGTTATAGASAYSLVPYASGVSGLAYANAEGPYGEIGTGIAVDSTGVYVGGITSSTDFPVTTGAAATSLIANASVPFLAKLSGGALIYATYLVSLPTAILITADGFAIDPQGNAYLTGMAYSTFPTTAGAFLPSFGTSTSAADCSYVAKMNPTGSALVYATLFGCAAPSLSNWQEVFTKAIAADAAGNTYITGVAFNNGGSGNPTTANLPTTAGAYQTTCALSSVPPAAPACAANAFVSKINPTGSALVYSTYLGGKSVTQGFDIAVNSSGEAVVAGETVSVGANTFPTTSDAVQTSCVLVGGNCRSGFVSEISADGSSLVYSTYLSGSGGLTGATAVAVDGPGNIYVAGATSAADLPTTAGAFDNSLTTLLGGFVLKLGAVSASPITIQPTSVPAGAVGLGYGPVTFTETGGSGTITWTESGTLPAGISFVNGVLQGTPNQPGTFSILVTATDQNGSSETVSLSFTIYPPTTATFSLAPCSATAPAISTVIFSNTAVGSSTTQTVCTNNTGANTLYLQLGFAFTMSPIFVTSDTCPFLSNSNAAPTPTNGLAPGASCQTTYSFTPAAAITYTASRLYVTNAGSPVLNFSGTGITPSADVSIAGTGSPTTVVVGGTVSYTFTVLNHGPNAAASVVLADRLPSGLQSVVAPPTCTNSGGTLTCNLGTIASGAATTVTITATVLAAGTLTNTATVASTTTDPNTTNNSVTVTTTITPGTTGGGGTGCACSKTGPYLAPNAGVSPAPGSSSPNNKYTFAATGSSSITLIVKKGAAVLLNQVFSSGSNALAWGFSPDDDRFVIDDVSSTTETVSVYNLAGSTPNIAIFSLTSPSNSSQLAFSPSGQYLVYTGVTGPLSATMQIYNALTGKKVYQNDFSLTATPTSVQDAYSGGGWGFSPDKPETTFVYAFLTGQSSAQLELVQLAQPSTANTNGNAASVSLTSITSAFWQYNPCADALGIVTEPSGNADIQLLRTQDGTQVGNVSGIPLGNISLSSTATKQSASDVYVSGGNSTTNTYTLATNSSASLGCNRLNTQPGPTPPAIQPPDPNTGAAPVTVTFSNVTQAGQTSLTIGSTGPAGTGLFETPSTYFNLSTTAVFAAATVCINYSTLGITNLSTIQIEHFDETLNQWVQVGTSLDTPNSTICAQGLTSFSPFAVVENIVANPMASLEVAASPLTIDGSGNYVVSLTVTNGGNIAALLTSLTKAAILSTEEDEIEEIPTKTKLPIKLGDILPNGSALVSLTFPKWIGKHGARVAVRYRLKSSTGATSGTLRLTLPLSIGLRVKDK